MAGGHVLWGKSADRRGVKRPKRTGGLAFRTALRPAETPGHPAGQGGVLWSPLTFSSSDVLIHLATGEAAKRQMQADLGEPDHVEHATAVLVGEESIGTRYDAIERFVALANGRLSLERGEVYAHPAQGLEGRPRPLVGSLGDHIFIAERPAALRARGHELEGVLFWEIVGAGNQDVVADLALDIRLPELWVPLRESPQRRRVLSTQRAVHRLPDRYYGVEERIVLPKRGFHVQGRHRLIERRTDDPSLPIQDGEGLRQCLLVDLDGTLGAGGVGQGGETYYPIHLRLRVPRTERVGTKRIGVACLHEPGGWVLGRPEVAGLRFAAGESRGYHPRDLQELVLRQFGREYRGVPAATVGLGPREIDERQGRRHRL